MALVARMRRELVDERKWVEEDDFRNGVALAQIAPGPLAAQLAIDLGWSAGGALGATVVGFAFVIPSLIIVLILAALYVRAGEMPIIAQLFYGAGAAVIAVIARSGVRLARSTGQSDPRIWALVIVNAITTIVLQRESLTVVLLSGLAMVAVTHRRVVASVFMAPIVTLPVSATLTSIFVFFSISGLVVFGSGLAIIPFLHGGVVTERHWLTERQFLDAVAVSLLTPGPVVITVAFIGFIVAGWMGGLVAAAGVFLPAYLIVLIAAPHFRRLRDKPTIQAFVNGVTAAAVGALLGAVAVMATRTLVDVGTTIIAFLTIGALVLRPKAPEPLLIAAAAIVGAFLQNRI